VIPELACLNEHNKKSEYIGKQWWLTGMTENSTRHAETLREMESHKRLFQIRCSHHELELSADNASIACPVCGKRWDYTQDRGFRDMRRVFAAETDS
jgi:hypothetical protein